MQHAGGAAPPPGPPGPSALRSWAAPRFAAEQVEDLLSSPNICAHDVLSFALEHVFAWGDVVHTRFQRKQALGFVTKWLGRHPPGEDARLPSLARLCAQRMAMEVFPAVCDEINRHFSTARDISMARFIDALRAYFAHGALGKHVASILKEKGVPPHLQDAVAEEVFVFAIVYFLCVDIRTMVEGPPLMNEMHLPIGDEDDDDDDDCGHERLEKIVASFPKCGRGALATVGLLTHASCQSYKRNVMPDTDCAGIYHAHVVRNLFDEGEKELLVKHPFARSVALAPISSLLHAMVVNDEDPTFYEDFMTEIFRPWVRRASAPDKPLYFYLRLATERMMPVQPLDDLPPFSTRDFVGEFIDAWKADDILYDIGYRGRCEANRDSNGVKRLRLNGNFSKGEILQAAIVSREATLVDLEHCWHLDEECLGLVLRHLKKVKVMLLKGTPITEASEVIKSANLGRKQRIKFVFSDACKCCGERNGTIKELQLSRPMKIQRTS